MDIFGILDPDPHENLCESETLLYTFSYIPKAEQEAKKVMEKER